MAERVPRSLSFTAMALAAMLLCLRTWGQETGDRPPGFIARYGYEVVERVPQPRDHFVQGLQIVGDTLYVGTGQFGESRLLEYEFPAMKLRRQQALAENLFGEGVTRLRDRVYQLTWHAGKVFVYDARSLTLKKTATIRTQGWGLTSDGRDLLYSDGSQRIRRLDPVTLEETGHFDVSIQGQPLTRLNELEWIDDELWANVWMANQLVRIDPGTGAVTAIVDLRGLLPAEDREEGTDVLNGIAWDREARALWVTGKRWPWIFHIRPVPVPAS